MREQLLSIFQGQQSAMDYSLDFCILAAGCRWNKLALKMACHKGLNVEVITKLCLSR